MVLVIAISSYRVGLQPPSQSTRRNIGNSAVSDLQPQLLQQLQDPGVPIEGCAVAGRERCTRF